MSSGQNDDSFVYLAYPSEKSTGKKHIIIVGGGIIGVTAAYYLTQHPKFSPETHHITIIESRGIASGASGKAGGLIANWAFPEEIVPLSFSLHGMLNQQFDGESVYGYRRLNALSLEADVKNIYDEQEKQHQKMQKKFQDMRNNLKKEGLATGGSQLHGKALEYKATLSTPKDSIPVADAELPLDFAPVPMGKSTNELPEDLGVGGVMMKTSQHLLPNAFNWIKSKLVKTWSYIGEPQTTAIIHPLKFTQFLLQKAMETGAVDLILGRVTDIQVNEKGEACGVSYIPKNDSSADEVVTIIGASQVLFALGPWTSKILTDCPVKSLRVNSIIVRPEEQEKPIAPYLMFSELQIDENKTFSPEIYPRKDGIYICGEGEEYDIPDDSNNVVPNDDKCNELFYYVSKLSPNVSNGEISQKFASYLPFLSIPTGSGPLIGETNLKNLYIATGHSCWGINNGPATGLIVSQLMLDGQCTCADVTNFNPKLYFDATKINQK